MNSYTVRFNDNGKVVTINVPEAVDASEALTLARAAVGSKPLLLSIEASNNGGEDESEEE